MGSCRSEPRVRGTLIDKRMKILLPLLFLGTVSATPVGYYLVSPWYALFGNCGQVCVSPPCTCTQPVVIKPPEETDYECKASGSFPNRENASSPTLSALSKKREDFRLLRGIVTQVLLSTLP